MPVYSTRIESGSSVDMSGVNLKTSTTFRYVLSGNTPVELIYNVRVTDLEGTPSKGKVLTFMLGIIEEGKGYSSAASEEIEFYERTSLEGYISRFDKELRFRSGITR
jgi:hypothetical protein